MVFLFNNNRALYRVNLWETIYSPQTLWSALFLLEKTNMAKHNSREARRAYCKYYGVIPEGFDVHHKDRDFTNNSPGNLIALSRSAHCKEHRFDKNSLLMRIMKGKRRSYKAIFKRLDIMLYQINNNIYWD